MTTVDQNTPDTNKAAELSFRWKYVLLPLAILLLAVVLAVAFYPQLNTEIAYRFDINGSPQSWLSRGMVALMMLLAQLVFAAAAVGIAWGITRMGRSMERASGALKPQGLAVLMSNMIILPQIILGFAMLDIFIYDIYGSHLMPIWLFALIVMLLGGIVLAILFTRTFLQTRSARK